jgi:hypothetical protein
VGGRGGGGIGHICCVYSRGFLLLHSPMEPTTGWGVHGGLCVDTLRSVRVKKKRIREIGVRVACFIMGCNKYLHVRSC